LVVIPAGVPRKPGMTRDDLFKINAGIVKGLIQSIAKNAPNALIAVITNPVNRYDTVPKHHEFTLTFSYRSCLPIASFRLHQKH
jgi:malate/lactate dehydrogenase